jgi:hypothetical protein
MWLATLLHLAAPPDTTVFNGRAGRIVVTTPRHEIAVVTDGALDEPVWREAAKLVGFSSYFPTDDRPAADSTEVLVWYSPSAIHFGIRGYATASDVRATLATRDNLNQDDVVAIFLSTFNDGRQAFVFSVNPLGVQQDGVLTEGSGTQDNIRGGITGGRELFDPSPDFLYSSKGRLTDYGFEIELAVPLKSLRFQAKPNQDWGIHIERTHRATGAVSSWAPAKRNTASYLAQSGTLAGLHDLRRGLVLDVTPFITSSVTGAASGTRWRYQGGEPTFGGDVRWGMTSDLTLNGTVRPDFSQVESDAGQVQPDPRSALFFAEKRPFFLDGIELLESPGGLVYTRRIVQPVAATKLTGKVSGTSVAALFALDDRAASLANGDNPIFGLARLQRDLGGGSRIGALYTGRFDGPLTNQVMSLDGRITIDRRTSLDWQLAGSHDRAVTDVIAPLWRATFERGGRTLSLRYMTDAISDRFVTRSGFIGRGGIANVRLVNQVTFYGRPGSMLDRVSFDLSPYLTWRYQDFVNGRESQDEKYHLNGNIRLAGGWTFGASLLYEFQNFDPDLYRDYAMLSPRAGGGVDTVAYTGVKTLHNIDGIVTVNTPEVGGWSGSIFALWGRDVNFYEWSSASILWVNAGVNWRPTDQLRLDGTYVIQSYHRRSDGSLVARNQIPRLKVEYQVSRSLFLRLVGEYRREVQDSLRDDGRSNAPVVIRSASGDYLRAGARRFQALQADVLVAFQPNPGTVFFAGYGSSRDGDPLLGRPGLRRVADGFFLKASYLFRFN